MQNTLEAKLRGHIEDSDLELAKFLFYYAGIWIKLHHINDEFVLSFTDRDTGVIQGISIGMLGLCHSLVFTRPEDNADITHGKVKSVQHASTKKDSNLEGETRIFHPADFLYLLEILSQKLIGEYLNVDHDHFSTQLEQLQSAGFHIKIAVIAGYPVFQVLSPKGIQTCFPNFPDNVPAMYIPNHKKNGAWNTTNKQKIVDAISEMYGIDADKVILPDLEQTTWDQIVQELPVKADPLFFKGKHAPEYGYHRLGEKAIAALNQEFVRKNLPVKAVWARAAIENQKDPAVLSAAKFPLVDILFVPDGEQKSVQLSPINLLGWDAKKHKKSTDLFPYQSVVGCVFVEDETPLADRKDLSRKAAAQLRTLYPNPQANILTVDQALIDKWAQTGRG